jgi:hypothetical protein
VAPEEEQLAWEARQRPRAAAAAIAAALLTLAGSIVTGLVVGRPPRAGVIESLQRAAEPGPIGREPSLLTPAYEHLSDRGAAIIAATCLIVLGYLGTGYAVTFLAAATRARRRELPKVAVYLPLVGGVLGALALLLLQLGRITGLNAFLDGPRTVEVADDATAGGLTIFANVLGLPGGFAMAAGFVLVALNAMRAGLLTRFMGVLGLITGVLVLFPLMSSLPVVQCFWLLALGLLLLGRWPSGTPPAWSTGRAEPWPSAQEARAGRRGLLQGRPAEPAAEVSPEGAEEPVPVAAGRPHPSSRKRKRKRRR